MSAEPTNAPGTAPTERPVSLTPACVRAIRAGRKSQLRSVATRQEGQELPSSRFETTAATDDDRAGFARWWDEVHARPDSQWNANPWVWTVEFERLSCT